VERRYRVTNDSKTGNIREESLVPRQEESMLNIDIDGLKDDSSWRRLTALLSEITVSDEWLETMRARLMARIEPAPNDAGPDTEG